MRRAVPRAAMDFGPADLAAALARTASIAGKTPGRAVSDFETAFADCLGTAGAVAFSSARAGMYFGLQALGFRPGDEVILPAYAFWVDAAMVALAGLKPVFADVDPRSANLDPGGLEEAVTDRTRAVFATHLNGLPAEMDKIGGFAARRGLRVIEDCARACGVRVGGRRLGFADIGVFSFGYGKNLYAFGGGMVTSNDAGFLERLRARQASFGRPRLPHVLGNAVKGTLLRTLHGPSLFRFVLFPLIRRYKLGGDRRLARLFDPKDPDYDRPPSAFETPMSPVQAELGLRFLKIIDRHNRKRQEASKAMREGLQGMPGLRFFSSAADVEMLYFAVASDDPDGLRKHLLGRGIEAEAESAADLTRTGRFRRQAGTRSYPAAAGLDGKAVLLPSHPRLSPEEIRDVIRAVRDGCRTAQDPGGRRRGR